MDIDDEDMDQAPSSSTGVKGEKKRFEVKKVNALKISSLFAILRFNDNSHSVISLDNEEREY